MKSCLGIGSCLLILGIGVPLIGAEEAAPKYETDVAPLLRKYCAGCHNDTDREGDLSLESFASLQQGLPKGPALLPGQSASSRIIRVLGGDIEPKMPPEGEPQLDKDQLALLARWIDAGAQGPIGAEPDRMRLVVPEIASHTDKRPIAGVSISPDGRLVAVARYAKVTLKPVEDLQRPGQPADHTAVRTIGAYPGKVAAVHFSSDGRKLVTASGVTGLGGIAALWNVEDGSLLREFKGHRDLLYDAELSPDGRCLATCSYDREIIIWDVASGEPLRTLSGHNGAVFDVDFSPDSEFLVSASADDTCKVWRISDGLRLDTLGQPLKEQYACRFSPDGRWIVAGGADNRIRVWRFVSRNKPRINPLIHARFAHEGPIVGLEFSSDGSQLISVSEDRTLKVWETDGYTQVSIDTLDDVAMALAALPQENCIAVGLMNGQLLLHTLAPASRGQQPDESASIVIAPTPMPKSKTKAADEQEPNGLPGQSQALAVPAQVRGLIHGSSSEAADSDLFRFSARAAQEWVIEVDAGRSGSPLDSFVEVLDAQGNRIERMLLESLRDSYFTFRGKDGNQSDDFRLFNWEEMELNEYLYANGEVVQLWLYPRGPDSGFLVYPGGGNRWGVFDTTSLTHALGEPCFIVQPHPPGTELIPNGLPVFKLYFENDDESRRALGTDSKLLFTAPADGDYLVRIRDIRGEQGDDFKYTLIIRPRAPDFQVTVHDKNLTVSPGSAREFKVTADRRDWFDGPIQVDVGHVPPGFTVSTPIVIEAGQTTAFGVVSADEDAVPPVADDGPSFEFQASAMIDGREVTQAAGSLEKIKLGAQPKLVINVGAAPGGAQPLPSAAGEPLEFEIAPGETIMLKVDTQRNGFDGEISFGKEDAGRNLPFGVYVDNIGLNGLLLLSGQSEREFFVTASKVAAPQSRMFHLTTSAGDTQASRPVILHVRPRSEVAQP